MRRIYFYCGFTAAFAITCFVWASVLGGWLITADPLEPAGAIVVFGGGVPFRAMEAARIYHKGFAPMVWVTQAALHEDDIALARLGISSIPGHLYSKNVLERLGVPSTAIQTLPTPVANTADEVRCIAQAATSAHLSKVILVTSKYHTRRVSILWHILSAGNIVAIVRYANDPSDPQHWWRRTSDAMSVSREVFGIANALAGFPIKSGSEELRQIRNRTSQRYSFH